MRTLILVAFTAFVVSSCGQRGNRQTSGTGSEAPGTCAAFLLFEGGSVGLQPYSLCQAELTSEEALMSAFYGPEDDFTREPTPATEAFYFPEADIRNGELVRTVRRKEKIVDAIGVEPVTPAYQADALPC